MATRGVTSRRRLVHRASPGKILKARLEICALRDAVAVFLTPESHSSFKQALEAMPQLSSGGDKKLLEELLNTFKSSMQLQLTCFQAASSTMVKT